jgi:hypothetical protein
VAVIKAKPEKFMRWLFPLAEREMVMSLLVTRVADDTFNGAQGDVVTMRIGGLRTVARKYEFRTRTAPIVLDDIEGGEGIPIKLDTHTYSATGLTDEQMTLDDIDWTSEVIAPQAKAVALDLDTDVRTAFDGLRFKRSTPFTEGTDDAAGDPYKVLVEANKLLNADRVATKSNRYWLVGSNVAAAILKHDRVSKFDWVGPSNTLALREATIARLAGTDVVTSDELDPDFSVLMHKSVLVMGSVAPVIPRGAKEGRRVTQNGLGLRWICDYDAAYLRDRSIVSSFSGITPVYDERVGGDGADRYDLKTYANPETDAVSVRAVEIPFTPAPVVP